MATAATASGDVALAAASVAAAVTATDEIDELLQELRLCIGKLDMRTRKR